MPIEVVYADEFLRAARKLQKRYPHVLDDAESLADQLEAGEKPGDRIQGLEYKAYKVRIGNRDAKRGKRGGYRVIYYVETAEQVVLITIYSKSDQSDIPVDKLRRFIAEYIAQRSP
jgi:mRNA-degrading endonuclease RelE of RelBE toxin-antitoxin system